MRKIVLSFIQIFATMYKSYDLNRKPANAADVAPPPADIHLHLPQSDTSSVYLPDDLIEDILLKCPVKSIIRFKSVSKSWQSLISIPRLSAALRSKLSQTTNSTSKFVVWATPQGQHMSSHYFITLEGDGKLVTEPVLGAPSGNFYIVSSCSCDGLILLRTNLDRFVLWNPFTKKNLIIPIHPFPEQHHFYHDPVSDDHRVVFVYVNCYAVYSCKEMKWGEAKEFPSGHDLTKCQTFVDGCFFYLSSYDGGIACFDCKDGELREVRRPKDVDCRVRMKAVSGRLCLYSVVRDGGGLRVWVMRDNGVWKKLTVNMGGLTAYVTGAIPVCLSSDDDRVVLWTDILSDVWPYRSEGKNMLYNRRENSFEPIGFSWEYLDRYCPYSENLYMPSSSIC